MTLLPERGIDFEATEVARRDVGGGPEVALSEHHAYLTSLVSSGDVEVLHNQTDALRLVAFVDRLYDAQVRIHATGVPLDQVFSDEMLAGGYRKKYLRATSRMIALTSAAHEQFDSVVEP